MDVLVGPSFSIDVKHQAVAPPPPCLFVAEEDGDVALEGRRLISTGIRSEKLLDDTSGSSSSSIGAPDDGEGEEDDEEEDGVVSSKGAFSSLHSLEDSLPIKRGLSNYFSGKSKSFADLSEVSSCVKEVKDLEKVEDPFNKRRRILMANKWSRRSSFYSWSNPKSMPLLTTLNEDEDDGDGDGDGDDQEQQQQQEQRKDSNIGLSSSSKKQQQQMSIRPKVQDTKFKPSFKCQSCFCLSDLQEEEQEHVD